MNPRVFAQIREYVRAARAAGQTYEEVREALLSSGWSEAQVAEYLPQAWEETEPVSERPQPAAIASVETEVAPGGISRPQPTPVVAPTWTPPRPASQAPPYVTPTGPSYPMPVAGDGLGYWFNRGWETFSGAMGAIIGGILLAWLVGLVSLGICYPPLFVGWTRMLLKAHDGEAVSAGDVFEGFRYFWSAWGALLLIALIGSVFGIPAFLLAAAAGHGDESVQAGLQLMANGILQIAGWIIGTFMLFVWPYIADGRGGAIEAIGSSVRVALERFGLYLVTVILTSIVAGLGALACLVGIYFTVPLAQCVIVAVYRSRFPAQRQQPRYL